MDSEEQIKSITKKTTVVYVIAAVIVSISALFKIMHWPYSKELEFGRIIAFVAFFATIIYENKQLKKLIRSKSQ